MFRLPARRPWAAALATALVALATGCSSTAGAAGGARLDPPAGAALDAAPPAVELTVPGRADLRFSHLTVVAGDGRAVDSGPLAAVDEDTVRRPVAITGAGDFRVAYHLVLTDGREFSATHAFSVATGRPPTDPPGGAAPAGHAHGIDPASATLLTLNAALMFGACLALLITPPRRRIVGHDD